MKANLCAAIAADMKITLTAEQEYETPENCFASGDDEQDAETVRAIRADYESGNEWAWCAIKLRVEYMGIDATEWLGACSYASREDFKRGGYYADMLASATEQLCDKVRAMRDVLNALEAE